MMSSSQTRRTAVVAMVAMAAIIAGCASPASSMNMTMRAADASSARSATPAEFKQNVAIKDVTGGKETNPAWVSNVGSAEFERALEESLRSAGILSANRQEGRFLLVAHLSKLDQPLFGFNMTVTSDVTYTLIERATGRTVWERSIAAPYTAKMGDALIGGERLKLANEGAIRESITRLVLELQAMRVAEVQIK